MNREMEFRGKLSHSSAWGFCSLLKIGKSYHILRDNDMYEDGHHVCQESDCPTWVESDTVGQFTGQYDKNDKKIYEGDVVRWEYPDYDHCTGWRGTVKNVCKVTFEYGSFRINAYPYNLGSCEDFFEDEETYGLEVIGNIYDNQDLLNKK
jgi:uncharacterized phage protein (TIGR01671 family)